MKSALIQDVEEKSVTLLENGSGPYFKLLALPTLFGAGTLVIILTCQSIFGQGINYSALVAGAIVFLLMSCLMLTDLNNVYEMRATKEGCLVTISMWRTRQFLVKEIVELKLVIEPDEDGHYVKKGIVRHSQGKLSTTSLTNTQFAKIKQFFHFVARKNPHINLSEDMEPPIDTNPVDTNEAQTPLGRFSETFLNQKGVHLRHPDL